MLSRAAQFLAAPDPQKTVFKKTWFIWINEFNIYTSKWLTLSERQHWYNQLNIDFSTFYWLNLISIFDMKTGRIVSELAKTRWRNRAIHRRTFKPDCSTRFNKCTWVIVCLIYKKILLHPHVGTRIVWYTAIIEQKTD